MKRFTLFLFLLNYLYLSAQVNSDCSVSNALRIFYDQDVKGLALKRMQAQNSPDNVLIQIPDAIQDSIIEGMAAILNTATQLPEADSVFNLYCIHDAYDSPAVFEMIISVDTNTPIAAAWEAGNTLTGDPILDSLLAQHGFSLQDYLSSSGLGLLQSDHIWNIGALADAILNNVPGVQFVDRNGLIGGAGRINYYTDENRNRYYEFRHEWNDCFDGCDNFYTWNFQVTTDCSVIFLGSEQGGVFGIEPLPTPTNCMLFTDTENLQPEPILTLFPNPGQDWLSWKQPPQGGFWQLYNSVGELLYTGSLEQNHINTQTLPKGIYWFSILDPQGQLVGQRRWIKS